MVMSDSCDVLIVGGAVMGSAVAYFLSENPDFRGKVIVLEKDRTYGAAASARSTSGVRQQFSSAVNVALGAFAAEFLREAGLHLDLPGEPSGVVFQERGYLFLGDASMVGAFEANNRMQRSLGVTVDLLEPAQLQERFPWLNVEDIAIGSIARDGEGWLDGYMLMNAFKRRARANGVEYRYVEATDLVRDGDRVVGAVCADGSRIAAGHVVNTAGGSGREVALMAGVELPLRNMKQMMFTFGSPFAAADVPFVFSPDGVFFRPDGQDYMGGIGIDQELIVEAGDFEVQYERFEEEVWPKLAHRVPGFEETRLRGGWAGHYDMNLFDHNAIVGRVPGVQGFYLANGFSGHGLMQSPGVGRGLSELIVYGAYRSLDLTDLSFERILANAPMRELIQY